jgi:hypothetical protein
MTKKKLGLPELIYQDLAQPRDQRESAISAMLWPVSPNCASRRGRKGCRGGTAGGEGHRWKEQPRPSDQGLWEPPEHFWVICGWPAESAPGELRLEAQGQKSAQQQTLTIHCPADLASQMGHLSPANASTPSGDQLRRTLAEVERLLREVRARDLGAPRAVAEAERAEAQRREWC